ncbi:MAG TPA: T9SS type A sorting domain-containing protein [Bacteroidia bacterium]
MACGAGADDPNACPVAPSNLVQLKEIRENLLEIIQKEQFDEAADYLISFVQDDEVKKLLITYYYEKGNLQKMHELIEQLADSQEEKKQFKKFFRILKQLKNDEKDIKQLDNDQKKKIKDVAKTETQAGALAREVLEIIKDRDNDIEPEVPVTSSSARIAKAYEQPEIDEREAELGQNIPNPSNNSTLVNVYVPEFATSAKVIIVNSLGQWIAEKDLVKGEQQVQFNTANFDAGIYFYTLYVDNKAISTKRMVIIK